jgi:hypothetical protein
MSVRTIESSSLKLAQINAPNGNSAIVVSDTGVVSLTQPSASASDAIATTSYVQTAIANATGTLSLNTDGSYEWVGDYQVFNNDQIISIGNNLTVPPTVPISGETCLANQTGIQFDNNMNGDNETDFLNFAGDQTGGFSFSTIAEGFPLKQNLIISNVDTATVLDIIGVGSDIQIDGTSIIVPNPASKTLPNTFTDINTFDEAVEINGPLTINNTTSVTDVMTFQPNTARLVNPTYPSGIGQVLLGPQGNIQLLNNQSTKGLTLQSGNYATSMLVDNLSNLNLKDGLVVTGNASATNLIASNNISTTTMTISGVATAPTAPITTNTTQLATCEFVQQNKVTSGGANVNVPNTFTATQTFQTTGLTPNVILSCLNQIPTSSISYNNNVTTITVPTSLNISNGTNTAILQPVGNGNLYLNNSTIVNQTSLTSQLSSYPTSASLNATYAQLTGASFTGSISTTGGISATSGKINNSPIVTSANLTPALNGYALLAGADFTGQVTAPSITTSGALIAGSGTVGGFPIATSQTLAGYANTATDNTFTGSNTFKGYVGINNHLTVPATSSGGAGCQFYWNTVSGSGATDLLCNGEGGQGGLNIYGCPDGGTPTQCAIFQPASSTIYGSLNITNPTAPANTTQLKCDVGGTLIAVGSISANTFSTLVGGTSTFDGVSANGITTGSFSATGTTTLSGTSTCPTITVNDKYPTTNIVNAQSLINYINSQQVASQYFAGQIISGFFPFNSPNLLGAGFLYCNGSPYDGALPQYSDLYSVIGTNYGSGGGTIFYLPDLRGKNPLGGNGDGGNPPIPNFYDDSVGRLPQTYFGTSGGVYQNSQAPAHNHPISDPGHAHSANVNYAFTTGTATNACMKFQSQDGSAPYAMVTNGNSTGITIQDQNAYTSIGTLSPYLAVNYFIYAGPP